MWFRQMLAKLWTLLSRAGAWVARVVSRFVNWVERVVPSFLNWLVSIVEPLVVLGLAGLIGYTAYWLAFGPAHCGEQKRLLNVIKQLNENWKAGLILLLVLFYRTIRMFLEQAEEIWGVKRKRLQGQELNPASLESRQEQK